MKTESSRALSRWLDKLPGTGIRFDVNRQRLYRVHELYDGYDFVNPDSWTKTFDRKVYEWTLEKPLKNNGKDKERHLRPYEAVAANLHDVAITRALGLFINRTHKSIVGFMGGHDIRRDNPLFEEIARIARTLRHHRFLIVSGGGPGLMEAANFGAFMAPYDDHKFNRALRILKLSPDATDQRAWIASAASVREMLLGKWNGYEPAGSVSVGIPTWYYGSEPPNLFASHSGKYFFNSVREDGLVSIADCGTIFTEGAAGTVQEIFQGSTLNYYEIKRTKPTPMILFGKKYWNPGRKIPKSSKDKPVYPLLEAIAKQSTPHFSSAIRLTDSGKTVINFVVKFRRKHRRSSKTHAHPQRFKGRPKAVIGS
ncbi:MAG TPA: hypothetical protein VGH91_07085 [Gammaproteobacteria bacterium]|jgi:predicted Rossmann-fold nucleotide-binding protein